MAILCGILGQRDAKVVRRMAAAMGADVGGLNLSEGTDYAVASDEPLGDGPCLVDGTACGADGKRLNGEALYAHCQEAGVPGQLDLGGAFAAAVAMNGGVCWWLMRDRLGRKPLFYYQRDSVVLFASALRGITGSGLASKHLNLPGLDSYLTLRCVPGPETIIQGVYRVPPGHALVYEDGTLSQALFAAFDFTPRRLAREEAAERLLGGLREALGSAESETLLFSGGIDSAALAGLRSELEPLFVQLERTWQHEGHFAKESARLLRRPLRTVSARKLTEDSFAKAIRALDEPVAAPAALPLWLLFEEASKHATSVITGHGADELLGGYPRYHFLEKAHGAYGLVPVTLLAEIAPVLPPNAFIRRGSRYLASIRDATEAYLSLISVFDWGERESMYTDVMRSAVSERGGAEAVLRTHFAHSDLTRNVLALDLGVGLPDLLVAKWERLAGAHGVRLELPYLDDRVVDFATTLPANIKFGVRSKPLLRLAIKEVAPARVRLRARRDFRIPMEGRLVQVIEVLARQIITRDRVEGLGVFKWQHVEQVVRSSTHNVYRRRQFWALLMFFAWYREFMEN